MNKRRVKVYMEGGFVIVKELVSTSEELLDDFAESIFDGAPIALETDTSTLINPSKILYVTIEEVTT